MAAKERFSEVQALWQQRRPDLRLMDFQTISKAAFAQASRFRNQAVFPLQWPDYPQQHYYHDDPGLVSYGNSTRFWLYPNGIAWFGGENEDRKPIGKPEDYLEIRDNPEMLKDFVENVLNMGRISEGERDMSGFVNETNPADYISWLYQFSENPDFKSSLEKVVVDLLASELGSKFVSYEEACALKRQEEEQSFKDSYGGEIEGYVYIPHRDLMGAIIGTGLNNPQTPEEVAIRSYFEKELGKTLRPDTLEEFILYWGGKNVDPEMQKILEEQFRQIGSRQMVHFSEASDQFKAAMLDYEINKKSKRDALLYVYIPQFNRLVGLLDVISAVGKPDNGFAQVRTALQQKVDEGFFKDTQHLYYPDSEVDIYESVQHALAAVTPDLVEIK